MRLAGLHVLIVAIDRALPSRTRQTPITIVPKIAIRLEQAVVLDYSEYVRHQNVSYGEVIRSNVLAAIEPPIQIGKVTVRPTDHKLPVLAASLILEPIQHQNVHQWNFNRIHSGETPTHDLRFANEVARDQFPRLFREINQNGGRLRQHHTLIIDNWDLLERADPAVRVSVQVMRRMIHSHEFERDLYFLKRPKNPEIAGVAPGYRVDPLKTVELQHGHASIELNGMLPACRRRVEGAGEVSDTFIIQNDYFFPVS